MSTIHTQQFIEITLDEQFMGRPVQRIIRIRDSEYDHYYELNGMQLLIAAKAIARYPSPGQALDMLYANAPENADDQAS